MSDLKRVYAEFDETTDLTALDEFYEKWSNK